MSIQYVLVCKRLTLNRFGHAPLTVCPVSIEKGPPKAHGSGSQCQGFDYIRTTSHTTVDIDFSLVE